MAISITKISLNLKLESDQIGMAFVHPFVPITEAAPFRIAEPGRLAVSKAWLKCLSTALIPIDGFPNAQFIVFPEFSLPFDSLPDVEAILKSDTCTPNTIVITGTEWIDRTEYLELLKSSDDPANLKQKQPAGGLFVNSAIIWVKTADNKLQRFVQPKLRPNREEAASGLMYSGHDVLLFTSQKPDAVSFATLVCFDCIAIEGETQMFEQLKTAAPETSDDSSINWHLTFVPQYNLAPEHTEFFQFAKSFLNSGGSVYNTADSAVAFVNAANPKNGRTTKGFGRSSIFYRSGRWQSLPDTGPLNTIPGTYAIETLDPGLMRARLREDGPSMHRFTFLKPWKTGKDAGSSRVPLLNARSRRILKDGELGEWKNIPALTKVVSDWLPDDLASSNCAFIGRTDIRGEYSEVRAVLLRTAEQDSRSLWHIIGLLLLGFEGPCSPPKINPDGWQQPIKEWQKDEHGLAIVDLVLISSLLRILNCVTFPSVSGQYTGRYGDSFFAVIDGWNQCKPDILIRQYIGQLNDSPMGEIIGKDVTLILNRTKTTYLGTQNNTPELVTFLSDTTSRRDEDFLRGISPDLVSPVSSITSHGTRIFKQFGAILQQALDCDSKALAAKFLRERLANDL